MRAAAVTAVTVAIVAAGVPTASADLTVPTISPTPLPSVSVPLPTPSLPTSSLPQPSLSDPAGEVSKAVGGSSGTGGSGATAVQGAGPGAEQSSGPGSPSGPVAGAAGAGPTDTAEPRDRALDRRVREATPMVAGTPAARDLLDDEQSPQLLAASRDFLAADQGIAEIARQKRVLAQLAQQAQDTAALYRAYGYDLLTARTAADRLHARHDELRRQLSADVRDSYAAGDPSARMSAGPELADTLARLSDSGTRADLRVGDLTVRRLVVRAEYERIAERHAEAQRRLRDASERIAALAAQRSTALEAVRAAQAGDIALYQARVAESGELGAAIRAASDGLERSGRTEQGTGSFTSPLSGHVTSPFGMRRHPILGYVKLHTGTDFAGGDTIVAADRGRVLMTVTSTAYGLFTVIDHGVVDGKRVTTAYAHQAAFLVEPGDEVRKGQPIGVVGSTGYSTGPHLHFEVREDGTVVDPMTWLAR